MRDAQLSVYLSICPRSASVARSRRLALRPSRKAVAPRVGREPEDMSLGGSAPAPPTTPDAASEQDPLHDMDV